MKLSVVIVNFNGVRLLPDCLGTLEAQTRPADEVIVVDNKSSDASVDLIQQEYPWVDVVQAGSNLGFAGGNNLGIRHSEGEIIVLLNNDTVPSPRFLEQIANPLEYGGEWSAVAGVMLFSREVDRVATAGIAIYDDGIALDREIGSLWRDLSGEVEVFGPSGGAAAFRRDALIDVELFPEPYFLYLEDVDLAWRLRLREHRTVAVRDAWVLHVYSASAGEGSPAKDYFLGRNRAWTLMRCWPGEIWRRNWWRVVIYEIAALTHALPTRRWGSIRGRWHGWTGFRRVLRSRRVVQRRATSDVSELLYWVHSAQSVRSQLRVREAVRSFIRKTSSDHPQPGNENG